MAVKLIVVLDADKGTVENRLRQLEAEVRDHGMADRTDREAVALLIPKRNIETWIHCLMGTLVDENEAYPKFDRERDSLLAVERLVEVYRSGSASTGPYPDSLRRSLEELWKIL